MCGLVAPLTAGIVAPAAAQGLASSWNIMKTCVAREAIVGVIRSRVDLREVVVAIDQYR